MKKIKSLKKDQNTKIYQTYFMIKTYNMNKCKKYTN